jgi:3-oxoacyl-[acyl-carrier protein] reductase
VDLQLRGKRALVTGSSTGIGEAIAQELAAAGVKVAVHGRDRTRTEAVVAKIAGQGGEAVAVVGEVATEEGSAQVVQSTLDQLGGVDILVNNAGGGVTKGNPSWLDVSTSVWMDCLNLNLLAPVRLCQAFAPGMMERGWGRIINISSGAATSRKGSLMDYGAAKAALENFSVNLSKQVGPRGVTVNIVSPGLIQTPTIRKWLEFVRRQENWPDDPEFVERAYAEKLQQSVPRIGQPEDIAAVVAFMASPLSSYVNGARLAVDGGVAI